MIPVSDIGELGLFGGSPLFPRRLPRGQLNTPDVESFLPRAERHTERKWFSNGGPVVRALGVKLAEFHQVHCVAVANAALGLMMVLQVVTGARHGEVVMPAMGYRGLPYLARWAGQRPRFVDLTETLTLSPAGVESAISSNTKLYTCCSVSSSGFIDELESIAALAEVPIIFDSVWSAGCTYKGIPVGRFGLAEVFSLHATKLLNGFEGGYLTTDDDKLASILRRQRDFNDPGIHDLRG